MHPRTPARSSVEATARRADEVMIRSSEPGYNGPRNRPSSGPPRRYARELAEYGYIKAENKQKLAARLARVEGQARGIRRMIEREEYCVDILTQITSSSPPPRRSPPS